MSSNVAVDRAFSSQAPHFDLEDAANPVLQDLRKQVYHHLERTMQPASSVLELNAGTGIDALWLAMHGHTVLATDVASGMIHELEKKASSAPAQKRIRVKQLSYDSLAPLLPEKFDHIFSNFGGLNCIESLHVVATQVKPLLTSGGLITWVIMPPICPWEIASIVKGNRRAFRRWARPGVLAHLEGNYFRTWYHSLGDVRRAFGSSFELVACESLALLSPPPHRGDFPAKHPSLYRRLRSFDASLGRRFPFNRWGDHIIVTLRKKS